MAFVDIEKGHRLPYPRGNMEIRMAAHRVSRKGASRGVYFSISAPVVEQVGWTKLPSSDSNERKVCACRVQEGVGDDAGFFLLREGKLDEPHTYTLGTGGVTVRAYTMNIAGSRLKHYLVADSAEAPSDNVEFTVDETEHTILIQCPDWLRYDPQSYTPPPRQLPPKIPAQETKPVPPTRAVASGVKEIVKEVAKDIGFPNRKIRRAAVAAVTKSMQ